MPETTPKEQAVEELAKEGFVNPDDKEIQGFLDEDAIQEREHGCVCPNTQAQGQDCGRRETRRSEKRATRKPQV